MAQIYRAGRYENRDYFRYRRRTLKCVTVSNSCHRVSSRIFQRHDQPAASSWHSCVVISPVRMSEEHFDRFENDIAANSVGKHVSINSRAYITHHTKFTQADLSLRDVTCRHAWVWKQLTLQFVPRCRATELWFSTCFWPSCAEGHKCLNDTLNLKLVLSGRKLGFKPLVSEGLKYQKIVLHWLRI
jgi:hypothetical protein